MEEYQCLQDRSGEGFVISDHSFHFLCREPLICFGVSVFVLSLSLGVRKERRLVQLLDITLQLLSPAFFSPGALKNSRVVSASGIAVSPLSLEDK